MQQRCRLTTNKIIFRTIRREII